MKNKSILIFGAGKIGRSFIGQLFSAGGYEVVFADISQPIINAMNVRKKYEVIIKSAQDEDYTILVENVRALDARDKQNVKHEICHADILAISVGQNALPAIFPLIAEGLNERYKNNRSNTIDIIIAENMLNASVHFKEQLQKYLPGDFPIEQFVGLIETSIGKMVPIVPQKIEEDDILRVFAEPYNTLILDQNAFRNPTPAIKGLAPKKNIKAWVDRKLFIHNLGHATAAYIGYLHNPNFVYLYEALEVPEIFSGVKATMQQSANALLKKYSDEFSSESLDAHIDNLLYRFQNRALGDTIFRVGCDLPRKLGPNDRLVGAIRLAQEMNVPYEKILFALVCGFCFRAKDEDGKLFLADAEFDRIYRRGIQHVLLQICGLDEKEDLTLIEKAEGLETILSVS